MTRPALGAYGLRIVGLAGAAQWMQPIAVSSPRLRVEKAQAVGANSRQSRLDSAEADLRLVGEGRLHMRRDHGLAVFSFPAVPSDEDLLHPYLAPAAALAHLWAGREALHGGVLATSTGAIALLGEKDTGKSTTLAWLATEHCVPVLSDDLIVVERGAVLSGPRCLDLRRAGSLHYLDLEPTRTVRNAERLRMTLPPAAPETPLITTVVLRWGQRTRLEAVAPARRLQELLPQRMYRHRLAGDPRAILSLAALPMLILTRPRGKTGLRDAATALTDYAR